MSSPRIRTTLPLARELYHTALDPLETDNLSRERAYAAVDEEMKAILDAGWKKALPEGIVNLSSNPRGDDSHYAKSPRNRMD